MTYVFVSFRPPYLCPSKGHKHGVSIQSLINLSRTFLRTSPARNIAQTWIFARLFEYSSSFISLILDFICWMVLMMVWQWKPAILSLYLNLSTTDTCPKRQLPRLKRVPTAKVISRQWPVNQRKYILNPHFYCKRSCWSEVPDISKEDVTVAADKVDGNWCTYFYLVFWLTFFFWTLIFGFCFIDVFYYYYYYYLYMLQ